MLSRRLVVVIFAAILASSAEDKRATQSAVQPTPGMSAPAVGSGMASPEQSGIRTVRFRLFGRTANIEIKVGVLGVLTVLTLAVLLTVAVVFAWLARRRLKYVQETNRQLENEIEQRKRAEEEVQKLNADLERRVAERTGQLAAANKELEAFTYAVSHDLRAPLRQIDGFASILVEEHESDLDADALHCLRLIRDGVKNMGQMIDDLLAMGRVDRAQMVWSDTDLNALVDAVMRDLGRTIQNRSVEWRIGHLPVLSADPGLMKFVMTNLLSNAIKYTSHRDHALIEVDQMEAEGSTVIFVRDNGVGFDQRYAYKLFGLFQRLHRSDEFEGTGVGLATVQRIIHKHGGRIWAEAQVGKGAAFYFSLATSAPPVHDGESRLEEVRDAAYGG